MATMNLDHEILALEREYWDAMISKDPQVATRLTADESIVIGPQGVGKVSKKDVGSMLTSETWKLKKYEFSDVTFSKPDNETAVIAYTVKEDLEVDGTPLSLEASDSTLWVRRGGEWLCMLHTETPKGDPFGRDRTH